MNRTMNKFPLNFKSHENQKKLEPQIQQHPQWQQKRKNEQIIDLVLTAVKNGQEYGDSDHFHLEMDHIGVDVVDLAGGEVPQPSVLTLQHQLQREQSPQAQPLS